MKVGDKVKVILPCPIIGDTLVGYQGVVTDIDTDDVGRGVESKWNIYVDLDIEGEIEERVPFAEHELEVISE